MSEHDKSSKSGRVALGTRDDMAPLSRADLVSHRRLVAHSAVMMGVVKRLHDLRESAVPLVLFAGEIGTGKHTLARVLHANGPRRHRPFIEVPCADLTAPALHERLAEAVDGTLFLDEIGSTSASMQRELLAAITGTDIQIIAATRVDLSSLVKRGEFHADLFDSALPRTIALPPLRDRGADILAIADLFLAELSHELGRRTPSLSFAARDALAAYRWPGNLRELRNELEHVLLVRDESVIEADYFRLGPTRAGGAAIDARSGALVVTITGDHCPIDQLEYQVIREALARCHGNISRAARFVGITRQTMLYRMKKHGLRNPSPGDDDR